MLVNKSICPRFFDRIYSISFESFMADRTGLDGTTLHYLPLRQAMVNIHIPVHSKITLTCSLTCQTDHCTSRRRGFKVLLLCQCGPFVGFSCAYCLNKLPEHAPTVKIWLRVTVDYATNMCANPPTLN